VRVADGEVQLVAGDGGLVAHTDQRQLLLKALAHTDNHVVDQLAQRAAHGVRFAGLVHGNEGHLAVLAHNLDQSVKSERQRAAGALDTDLIVLDRDIHALRDSDRHFSYAGHFNYSLMPA